MTNSYGHTTDAPRFRVIILTSATIGPTAYEALWDAVAGKLREAGYIKSPKATSRLKKSGLDRSKRSANSLFYLPAQAASSSDTFFDFHNGHQCRPLDPEQWLRNVPLEMPSESPADSVAPASAAGVAEAIAVWRSSSPGKGNDAFFTLALSLRTLGLDLKEIEQVLSEQAAFARSPAERRNQIASIMQSLSKARRAA
ncbi:hypothetical protein BST63_11275 [Bradyrhizobium canariense]|uniref:Primase C-terminal 1 domain-containing protein n=1 Tax=Bradyrhizobium canariense TaxID=255045 RepID=A0ABX3X620_9BRAD|nr:hypothetical protein BSR47_12350 [Bradyrhizobium canariense]OSJ30935.1 hypothetical protein BST63_11275 [Bradyrhizobium canariense]